MTRDEAIRTWREMLHPENGPKWSPEEWSKKAIDCYVALGMLKLDEPKSLPQKLRDFVMDTRLAQGDAMQRLGNLKDVLDAAGLRIVEK